MTVLDHPCPSCESPAGFPCIDSLGTNHASRVAATLLHDFPHADPQVIDKWARIVERALNECGAECMASKGPLCECSCGGKNHGVNHA